jgi:MoaD family protein
MKIQIKGFFSIKEAMGSQGEYELEVDHTTIRELLIELSERYGKRFKDEVFDPLTNDVKSENQILVNGRHYRYLTNGLNAELKDGDLLAIFPAVAGG